MGARGGVVRVTAFKCGTCGELFERRDGGRKAAVECCNEEIAAAERKAREKVAALAFAKVPTPRVEITRRLHSEYATATVKCSRCYYSATVKVEVRSTWNGNLSRSDASKKASALAKAQIGRHLKRTYICGR